jgi:hypothetical protein
MGIARQPPRGLVRHTPVPLDESVEGGVLARKGLPHERGIG